MQLNFMGLLVIGAGIVALGLGINGSYTALGQTVKASLGQKTTTGAGQSESANLPGVNAPLTEQKPKGA